jgi:Uma2 family endonuclease
MPGDPAERRFRSVAEFLLWEEQQPERWEFLDGVVSRVEGGPAGMAGGTLAHDEIVFNVKTALQAPLRARGCRIFTENVKLKMAEVSAYPDLVVICSPVAMTATTISEASMLIEVLSKGSESKDRGVKLQNYTELSSLQYYILISQEAQIVETYARSGEHWEYTTIRDPAGAVGLASFGIRLALPDIYRDTGVRPFDNVFRLEEG